MVHLGMVLRYREKEMDGNNKGWPPLPYGQFWKGLKDQYR